MEQAITISKDLIKQGELILIPRKKYEELLNRQKVTERDVLRWASEARFLKKIGKLPRLESWSDLGKK